MLRKRARLIRLIALLTALLCCVPPLTALGDASPVLYRATALAKAAVYSNTDAGARTLTTVPKGASLYVTSPEIIQGSAGSMYVVLYNTTRGFMLSENIKIDQSSVEEQETSVYVPVAYGDERAEVITLQQALQELGFLSGKADGVFGSGTQKAVQAFQKANGLSVTGAGDLATQKLLYEGKPKNSRGKAVKVTTAPAILDFTLTTGHTGYAVEQLQKRLHELGYYSKTIDGQYGGSTEAAVRAFQKANGLKQTGRANAATQHKLFGDETPIAAKVKTTKTPKPTKTPKITAAAKGTKTPKPAKALTPTPLPAATYPFTTYTLEAVNLRKAASASSLRLLTVPKGAEITVSAVSGDFVQATYNGKAGYIAAEYVNIPTQYLPGKILDTDAEAQQNYEYLLKGRKGQAVRTLQEALTELGFYSGAVDGVYGDSTVSAVKAFQKANGIKYDGDASPELQQLILEGRPLNAKGKKTDVKVLPPMEDVDLVEGDKGTQVTALQEQLIRLNLYSGQPTGVFDSATLKAVKEFQNQHHLTVDGKVGSKTRSLLNLLAATPTPVPYVTATPSPTPTATPKAVKTVAAKATATPKAAKKTTGKAMATPKAKIQKTATPAPSYTPVTAQNVVVMRNGTQHEAVKRLQLRLAELGYYEPDEADGIFDEDEVMAVKEFQRACGLTIDGVAGLGTQQRLYAENAPEAEPLPVPTPVASVVKAANGVTATPGPLTETLKTGSKGENVKTLQRRLAELGYYTGKVDGDFGAGTFNALTAFQKANKLTADGVAGTRTLNKLYSSSAIKANGAKAAVTATPAASKTTAKATATPAASTVLRTGDKGTEVKAMQKRLVELGYLTVADGAYGIKTYNAVAAFQKRNGLKADGVAGKQTLTKLNSSSAIAAAGVAATPVPKTTVAPVTAAFTAPKASEVRNANWYSEIRARAKLMPDVVIYHPDTGLHFNLHMFSFGKHADSETPTAADAEVLNKICGVNSWTPHYVWVIFSDGRVYIGSIHSHAHGVDHTANNGLEGHICLHFPRVMSEAEATGPYAVSHQKEILYGWEVTQALAK